MSLATCEDIDRDAEARKHLWKGLQRMAAGDRVRFLAVCCKTKDMQGNAFGETRVTSSTGTVHEVYMDLMLLSVGHQLNLGKVCDVMEKFLKRYKPQR